MPDFSRYVGIDYSGTKTPTESLKGLRVYLATPSDPPREVGPPPSPRRYWTRRGVAAWLVEIWSDNVPTLVGIDRGFSFPIRYFDKHAIQPDWQVFLEDFRRHWPTDGEHVYVGFVRDGSVGNGAARSGLTPWRRLTEIRARSAKSVFTLRCARLRRKIHALWHTVAAPYPTGTSRSRSFLALRWLVATMRSICHCRGVSLALATSASTYRCDR